ncbi:phosphatidylinositol 4-kinase, putative [Entamoeba dispar SAW760]|uniref:1-phosphatidylinositol 4-kinase n=1 Tax=Entamoeba dispar (strain ATCC PRA-260 / SAW760) TaxID=370354 RepID=B0EJW7_ENTDS|nr:phosphatidylinositol 4-kinase, putative [Entamoeba dispar SAW760]EDR25176.1 phosphatidylinositol 4-kinase, putative [Entamoeba dispar SAW760]|eukprot:EDR25176.1 phosphatidylinositol 4-kinase, putative [Entamoeba dispar SAW760]
MSLKLKYIQILLKGNIKSHQERLKPFFQTLLTCKVEEGIQSIFIIETLVGLQVFYNGIQQDHPMYQELTETLSKYIQALPSITINEKHTSYLKEVLNHPKGSSIHEIVFKSLLDILNKKEPNEVRIMINVMNIQKFIAFSDEEKKQLIESMEQNHSTEQIVRPIIALLNKQYTIDKFTLPKKCSIIEQLEYHIALAQQDPNTIRDLESTLSEILLLNYLGLTNYYDRICLALKLVSTYDPRCLDDFRKHCILNNIPSDKLKSIIKIFSPIITEGLLPRFLETTRSQISIFHSSSECSTTHFTNLIQFTAYFCIEKDNENTTQNLLNYLINLIDYPPSDKDICIINTLPSYLSLNDYNQYKLVIDHIMNIFKRADRDAVSQKQNDTNNILNSIYEALTSMAKSITNEELRFDLLKQIVGRFIQFGNTIKTDQDISKRKETELMGKLLKPISLLISGMENSINKNNENKLFRTFWFYCVVLKFVIKEEYNEIYYNDIKNIASNLPPLIMKRSHILAEIDNETNSTLTRFYSTEQQKMFIDSLTKRNDFISYNRGIPLNRILMFISIFYLECFRCSQLRFEYITDYLDDSVVEDPLCAFITPVYSSLFKSVFLVAKTEASKLELSLTERSKAMTNLMSVFVIRLTTTNQTLFSFVNSSLNDLIDSNKSIVYNKRILFLLLHIVETISKMNTSNPLDVKNVRIAQTNFFVETPEDSNTYSTVIKNVSDFTTNYIKLGFKLQPKYMSHLIQSFILQLPTNSSHTHAGVKLALNVGREFIDMSDLTFNIFQKASCTGMVIGSTEVGNIRRSLLQQLKTFDSSNMKNDITKEAVSFIVVNNLSISESSDLLQEIVYSPMRVFTKEAMELAVPNWEWLICVSSKVMGNYLLKLIGVAWKETIKKNLGIFNSKYVTSNPLSSSVGNREQSTHASSVVPHREIIKFFSNILPIIEAYRDTTRLEIIRDIISSSLKAQMTPEPSSVGTRFMLLLLGLKIVSLSQKEGIHYTSMVESIEIVGLNWFENQPEWFECSRTQAEHDINILVEFNQTLLNVLQNIKEKKFGLDDEVINNLKQRAMLLLPLVGNEIERISVWNNPLNLITKQFQNQRLFLIENLPKDYRRRTKDYILLAWYYSPALAVGYYNRFPTIQSYKLLTEKILSEPNKLINNALAHIFIATPEHVESNIPQLNQLLYWEATDPPHALNLLKKSYHSNPFTTLYALRVLDTFDEQTVLYYVPQLVQSLRYDSMGLVEAFIIRMGKKYQLVAHQLIWNCDTYSTESTTMTVKQDPAFVSKLKAISKKIVENYDEKEMELFKAERGFFENFTRISGELIPIERDQRTQELKDKLGKLKVERNDLYVPTNPNAMVVDVSNKGCACLRSAAKVPILVNMTVKDRFTGEVSPLPVIFKAGDDIRSDMLAVQMIELFDRINKHAGLDIYLCPYHIIATGPDCGIIEVVRNSMSRDQMGEKYDGNMYNYFLTKYGGRKTEEFFAARANFIRSMSAYAIVSYILQIKDRHNGNILIDEDGHLIHIDFGFMFDRSPGGDMGIEKSPFKLTDEMISIMGGSPSAEQFIWFMEQGVKSFLAIRQYYPSIITLIELMLDTQMNVFRPNSMINLTRRFNPEGNCTQAAQFMAGVMKEAFSLKGTFFTYFYDKFQALDNGISM